jgi:hypothetical protein
MGDSPLPSPRWIETPDPLARPGALLPFDWSHARERSAPGGAWQSEIAAACAGMTVAAIANTPDMTQTHFIALSFTRSKLAYDHDG